MGFTNSSIQNHFLQTIELTGFLKKDKVRSSYNFIIKNTLIFILFKLELKNYILPIMLPQLRNSIAIPSLMLFLLPFKIKSSMIKNVLVLIVKAQNHICMYTHTGCFKFITLVVISTLYGLLGIEKVSQHSPVPLQLWYF